MRLWFWWGSGGSATPIVEHHEVVEADMSLRRTVDQDCAVIRTVVGDLTMQQTVGEDVER